MDPDEQNRLRGLMEVPLRYKFERFAHLPEIETFAKSERERKVLALFRNLRLTGSPFFVSARTPVERVEILKQAMTKSLKDPEFYKEYKKLLSEEPTLRLPDENQRAIRKLPRDPETIALYKLLAGRRHCRRASLEAVQGSKFKVACPEIVAE
jgi:hypothetical protein